MKFFLVNDNDDTTSLAVHLKRIKRSFAKVNEVSISLKHIFEVDEIHRYFLGERDNRGSKKYKGKKRNKKRSIVSHSLLSLFIHSFGIIFSDSQKRPDAFNEGLKWTAYLLQ